MQTTFTPSTATMLSRECVCVCVCVWWRIIRHVRTSSPLHQSWLVWAWVEPDTWELWTLAECGCSSPPDAPKPVRPSLDYCAMVAQIERCHYRYRWENLRCKLYLKSKLSGKTYETIETIFSRRVSLTATLHCTERLHSCKDQEITSITQSIAAILCQQH